MTGASERISLAAIAFHTRLGTRRLRVAPAVAAYVDALERALLEIASALRAVPRRLAIAPPGKPPPTGEDPDAQVLALTFALIDENVETLRRAVGTRTADEPAYAAAAS